MTQLTLPEMATSQVSAPTLEEELTPDIHDQLMALAHDLQSYAEKMGFPTPTLPE